MNIEIKVTIEYTLREAIIIHMLLQHAKFSPGASALPFAVADKEVNAMRDALAKIGVPTMLPAMPA